MKTMPLEEFRQTLKAHGVPHEHFAFRCPMCSTVQSAHDLIGAGSPSGAKGKGIGCNWTLGGFFRTHELEVVTEDGEHHPRFEPVTPEEALTHQAAKA